MKTMLKIMKCQERDRGRYGGITRAKIAVISGN